MAKVNYSELIKAYREKAFLTQKELAEKLGVSFVSVNRWDYFLTGKHIEVSL